MYILYDYIYIFYLDIYGSFVQFSIILILFQINYTRNITVIVVIIMMLVVKLIIIIMV